MNACEAFMMGFEDALEKQAGKMGKATRLVKARRAARAAGNTSKADRLTGIIDTLRRGMRGGERAERIGLKKRWGRDVRSGRSFRDTPKRRGQIRKPSPLSRAINTRHQPMMETMGEARAARAKSLGNARDKMKSRHTTTRWLSGGTRRG